jgi:hypothetical protein
MQVNPAAEIVDGSPLPLFSVRRVDLTTANLQD